MTNPPSSVVASVTCDIGFDTYSKNILEQTSHVLVIPGGSLSVLGVLRNDNDLINIFHNFTEVALFSEGLDMLLPTHALGTMVVPGFPPVNDDLVNAGYSVNNISYTCISH